MNLVVADASIQGDANLALALFALLKDTREIEYMAHQFHWNITGDKFKSMHEFYEEEYDQLFKDQDEIAEQIRQQGFFVPVIDNITLNGADYFKANEFETQLIHYYNRLGKNIELINKVNDLAKDNIAVQDLCARLQGLRSLSMNLKAKAMLKANEGVLDTEASVVKADVSDKTNKLEELAKQLDSNCKKCVKGGGPRRRTTYCGKITIPVEVDFELDMNGCGATDEWPAISWDDITKVTKENIISNLVKSLREGEEIKVTASVVESAAKELFKEGDKVNISGDISNSDYNCRVSSKGIVEENQKTPSSKVRVTIDEIDGDKKVSMLVNPSIVTLASAVTAGSLKETDVDTFLREYNIKARKSKDNKDNKDSIWSTKEVEIRYNEKDKTVSMRTKRVEYTNIRTKQQLEDAFKRLFVEAVNSKVTAGFDKGRYKEIDEEPKFFRMLREDCGIRNKNFYTINKGLRLALNIIKGTFEEASIRYFLLKNVGGYIRVELNDKVYIVGYTIYDTGKIKVWTKELKSAVPVNSFDYSMLNSYAKIGTKLVRGMLPTWLSV